MSDQQQLKCVTSHPYWCKRFAPVLTVLKQEPSLQIEISLRGGWIIGYKHLISPPNKAPVMIKPFPEYGICEKSVHQVFANVANEMRKNHVENGIIEVIVDLEGSKRRMRIAGYSNKKMKKNDLAIIKKAIFL